MQEEPEERWIGLEEGLRHVLSEVVQAEENLRHLLEQIKWMGVPLEQLEQWILQGPEKQSEKDAYCRLLARVWKGIQDN